MKKIIMSLLFSFDCYFNFPMDKSPKETLWTVCCGCWTLNPGRWTLNSDGLQMLNARLWTLKL